MTHYPYEHYEPDPRDLRPVLADILEGLAEAHVRNDADCTLPATTCSAALGIRGAQTLRWCAAREAPTVDELLDEIAARDEIIAAIDDALTDDATATKRLAMIRELVS
jgi:hypothetical protein